MLFHLHYVHLLLFMSKLLKNGVRFVQKFAEGRDEESTKGMPSLMQGGSSSSASSGSKPGQGFIKI